MTSWPRSRSGSWSGSSGSESRARGRAHGRARDSGSLFGLVVGLLVGLTAGRHATASLLFAFTEIFPARPVQFMEWARNAGLLRVTGIAYQCRHDSYQQWLAAGDVDRGVKTTLDSSSRLTT